MRTTVSKKKEQTHTNEKKETERKKEKRDKEEGKTKRPSGITAESIDQSIGRQRVAVNSSHCFVTDRAARANEGSRGRGDEGTRKTSRTRWTEQTLACLLAESIARATRCHRREPHVGFPRSLRATLRWITTLRRPVTLNFVTPRDLFARRLVPAARIRSGVNDGGTGERGFRRIYWG